MEINRHLLWQALFGQCELSAPVVFYGGERPVVYYGGESAVNGDWEDSDSMDGNVGSENGDWESSPQTNPFIGFSSQTNPFVEYSPINPFLEFRSKINHFVEFSKFDPFVEPVLSGDLRESLPDMKRVGKGPVGKLEKEGEGVHAAQLESNERQQTSMGDGLLTVENEYQKFSDEQSCDGEPVFFVYHAADKKTVSYAVTVCVTVRKRAYGNTMDKGKAGYESGVLHRVSVMDELHGVLLDYYVDIGKLSYGIRVSVTHVTFREKFGSDHDKLPP